MTNNREVKHTPTIRLFEEQKDVRLSFPFRLIRSFENYLRMMNIHSRNSQDSGNFQEEFLEREYYVTFI